MPFTASRRIYPSSLLFPLSRQPRWALRTLVCALAGAFSVPGAQAAEIRIEPGQTRNGLMIVEQGSAGRNAEAGVFSDTASTPGGAGADVHVRNEGAIVLTSPGGLLSGGVLPAIVSSSGGRGGHGAPSVTPSAGGPGGSVEMVNNGTVAAGAGTGTVAADALLSLTSRGGDGGATTGDTRLGSRYGPADGGAGGTVRFTSSSSLESNTLSTLRLRSEGGASGEGRFSSLLNSRPPRARGGNGGTARAHILRDATLSNTSGAGTAERPATVVQVVSQGGRGARGGDVGPVSTLTAHGNDGGTGGRAEVELDGAVVTDQHNAVGILVSSQGGAGGQGGTDDSRINSWPGLGGAGGSSGVAALRISETGRVGTRADSAPAVLLESRGGDGGDAGLSTWALLVSGVTAGSGGNVVDTADNASVQFRNAGAISTLGGSSVAVTLQSVGGRGGTGTPNGGSGSQGGAGGSGGRISALNTGTVSTQGMEAHGLFAQSVGGTGGRGGDGQFGFSFGGAAGGNAGRGGEVSINNQGTITTRGANARAVVAQSVGGGRALGALEVGEITPDKNSGGGAGGRSHPWSFLAGTGGDGGSGGHGGAVRVDHSGIIRTEGENATGVLAQSIGGGGGVAGKADAGGLGFAVAVGGSGGHGGHGGPVRVGGLAGQGEIETKGENAVAILAQSVGGAGGDAGAASAAALSVLEGWSLALGGQGGGGGNGGELQIDNHAKLTTTGKTAHAIQATSIGGGGGRAVAAAERGRRQSGGGAGQLHGGVPARFAHHCDGFRIRRVGRRRRARRQGRRP